MINNSDNTARTSTARHDTRRHGQLTVTARHRHRVITTPCRCLMRSPCHRCKWHGRTTAWQRAKQRVHRRRREAQPVLLITHVVQHMVTPHCTQPCTTPTRWRNPVRVHDVVQEFVQQPCKWWAHGQRCRQCQTDHQARLQKHERNYIAHLR